MTLLASCSHRSASPPNETFLRLLDPANFRLPLNARILSAPARITEGAEIWIEQRALKILPLALGLTVAALQPGRLIEWLMIHGPFSELCFSISVEESGSGGGSLVQETLRAALPWHYGGEAAEHLVLRRGMRAFLLQRGESERVSICKV